MSLSKSRLTFLDCPSRLWLFIARRRVILPVPVSLKRFFAPLWVFCFGMGVSASFAFGLRLGCCLRLGLCCLGLGRRLRLRLRLLRRFLLLRCGRGRLGHCCCLGLCRFGHCRLRRCYCHRAVRLRGCFRILCERLVGLQPCRLRRAEHHDHVPPVEQRLGLDLTDLLHILREPQEEVASALRMGRLAPTEHDRDLHLRPLVQEPDDVTFLGLEVVDPDLGTELDLLDVDLRLVLASQLRLL